MEVGTLHMPCRGAKTKTKHFRTVGRRLYHNKNISSRWCRVDFLQKPLRLATRSRFIRQIEQQPGHCLRSANHYERDAAATRPRPNVEEGGCHGSLDTHIQLLTQAPVGRVLRVLQAWGASLRTTTSLVGRHGRRCHTQEPACGRPLCCNRPAQQPVTRRGHSHPEPNDPRNEC